MKAAGLSPQRFSEFARACGVRERHPTSKDSRDVSGYYFLKLIGGLGLTGQDVENLSSRKFTAEQKHELRYNGFLKAHRPFFESLMKDAKLMEACLSLERMFKKMK